MKLPFVSNADDQSASAQSARWEFPGKTCERPTFAMGIAQPYSFAVNVATIVHIALALARHGSSWKLRAALLSCLVFEMIHAASHAVHIPGHVQASAIHVCVWAIAVSVYRVFAQLLPVRNSNIAASQVAIGIAFAVDVMVFAFVGGVAQIITGIWLLLNVSTVAFTAFSRAEISDHLMVVTVRWTLLVTVALVIESMYCSRLTESLGGFPVHVIVEIFGYRAFSALCEALACADHACQFQQKCAVRTPQVTKHARVRVQRITNTNINTRHVDTA